MGAILTQNTSWNNAAKALARLAEADALTWAAISAFPAAKLESLIQSSGYYRQKALRLKHAASFFSDLDVVPDRAALLRLRGIGPETADSVLLYAYGEPVMVVDAYLRRVLRHAGFQDPAQQPYEELRSWVEVRLPPRHQVLNEFHALVVAEAKSIGR